MASLTLFKFYTRAYKLLQNIVWTVQTKVTQYFLVWLHFILKDFVLNSNFW